jgi:hypothetical protein
MAKVIYAGERRTLGLLIITFLRSPMSESHVIVNKTKVLLSKA